MTDQPKRELLNDGQRERLCQLIRSIRRGSNDLPEWDMPGIVAAVVKLEQAATSAEEAIATAQTVADIAATYRATTAADLAAATAALTTYQKGTTQP